MKTFHFQLESLLKLRRSERDLHRQLLAQALDRDNELVIARSDTETARLMQFDELRNLEEGGQDFNIDASVARRSYAGQLSEDLGEIDLRRADLSKQIDVCRQDLIRADQAVKSLEKLSDQKRSEFMFQQERKEAVELEQTWLALNWDQPRRTEFG